MEGRYYWPLRYYIGGRNFLSGYPYFTDSGSKLLYARIGYGFPILKRISSRFINFNFSKLYGELFAEAGVVGNFARFEDIDFWSGERWGSMPNTDKFLTNVGGELRLQLFTFYRIPMFAYFQVAHPLNRDRVAEDAGPIDKMALLLWVRAVKRRERQVGKVDLHKLALRLKVVEMIGIYAYRRRLDEAYLRWYRLVQPN